MRKILLTAVTAAVIFSIPAAAAPCTTATTDCEQWVTYGSGPARSMVYASYPLETRNAGIRRALIMVHGTNRNADHYFDTAMAAAFLGRALDDTIVISPRFISNDRTCKDQLSSNEVNWPCAGDSWRSGGTSPSHKNLTAFDFMDELLGKLARKSVFPNLQTIVVAGHSAGGQYVTRYQMSNKIHETLGVPIRYVVANPSSYSWPDATRPLPVDDAVAASARDGWNTEEVHTKFSFGKAEAAQCQDTFNKWPFGLEQRTEGYTAGMSDEQLRKNLVSRPTTFLLGHVDTLPLGGFDSSCNAMAQGPTRRARGEAYVKYIAEKLGARHGVQIVSECGHNDRCVYTTDKVLPVIFPK